MPKQVARAWFPHWRKMCLSNHSNGASYLWFNDVLSSGARFPSEPNGNLRLRGSRGSSGEVKPSESCNIAQ